MRIAILIAGMLLTMPVQAAEQLTDAQLDRITAGGVTILDTPGRAVHQRFRVSGEANRHARVRLHGRRIRRRRGGEVNVSGPANVGIFVNDSGQAGRLVADRGADGFAVIGTPGQLNVSGPANVGVFVNNAGMPIGFQLMR